MTEEKKALVIRTADKDRRSHGGFQWPESGPVECPDWNPAPRCGGGLHGLIDGVGSYGLLSSEPDAVWQLVEVDRAECVEIDGKVKFPKGTVVYSGPMSGALTRISAEWVRIALAAENGSSTTGNLAHAATTGNLAHAATTGYRAHAATTGDDAHAATTGDDAHAATTGYRAHAATTGYRAHAATTGKKTVAACLGANGKAKAGPDGALVLSRWDDAAERYRVHVAYVGENGIEADTWYRLNDQGDFEKCE